MRRREVDAAHVGDEHLLHAEIGDPEDENVVELLAGLRIDSVLPPPTVEAEHLLVHLVGRPAVLDLLRGIGHGERERVEILHGRHGCDTSSRAAGCRSGLTGRS